MAAGSIEAAQVVATVPQQQWSGSQQGADAQSAQSAREAAAASMQACTGSTQAARIPHRTATAIERL